MLQLEEIAEILPEKARASREKKFHEKDAIGFKLKNFQFHLHYVKNPDIYFFGSDIDGINLGNECGNKFLDFMAVRYDKEIKSTEFQHNLAYDLKAKINFSEKLLQPAGLSMLNEKLKTSLSPRSLTFESKLDGWDMAMVLTKRSKDTANVRLFTHKELKEGTPWDIIKERTGTSQEFLKKLSTAIKAR